VDRVIRSLCAALGLMIQPGLEPFSAGVLCKAASSHEV